MQHLTDSQLLRAYAQRGSEVAFAELVMRHAGVVYAAALRQVESPDAARDVAQSVFTDLARKAAAVSRETVVTGWLFRSTRFAALTMLRTERRRQSRDIFGAGFTGLNRILFTERSSGGHADSPISGLSDTHVLTTVPPRVGSRWLISVFSPLGGTVTIPTGFFDITSETIGVQASSVYLVRDGGILTGDGPSSTVFVESGGSFVGGGGGNLTVYVQQGAAYTHGNGGNSLVFYEPGATISTGGGGGIFTEIPQLQPSFLPVPEPSTVGLFVLGLTFIILLGRSRVPGRFMHPEGDF